MADRELVQEKETTQKKHTKKYTKWRTERCSFCNTVDVIESGNYSKDLVTRSNKDNDSEDDSGEFWFCCVLHNWMYKHKHGISYMSNSTYNEEIKKLNMKRNKKRNRNATNVQK